MTSVAERPPITAATIRALLRQHLPVSEWALAFEVAAKVTKGSDRRADAVAMHLWPSRGNAVQGYEFKVSRADWRAELKSPEKAEAIAQYCDAWWIVTPPKIIKPGELPEAWGHLEVADDKLVVVKEAPKKSAVPVDRIFMAALFRRLSIVESDDFDSAVAVREAVLRLEYQRRSNDEIQRAEKKFRDDLSSTEHRFEHLTSRVAEFEATTGMSLEQLAYFGDELGQAVRFVLDAKVFGAWGSVERLRQDLQGALANLDKALANHVAAGPVDIS